MAQISIAKIFAARRRIRLMTVVAGLLLVMVFGQLMINKPNLGKAVASGCSDSVCTITEAGTLSASQIAWQGGYVWIGQYSNYTGNTLPIWYSKTYNRLQDMPALENLTFADIATTNNMTIKGVEVITLGTHFFTNLTIRDSAIVTHAAIERVTDFQTSSTTLLTDAAKLKRVDLRVSDELALLTGGNIDVDAKGYPGGDAPTNGSTEKGWGPAGGTKGPAKDGSICTVGSTTYGAGAGGNNGKGGDGIDWSNGIAYAGGRATPTAFDYGSGGGSVSMGANTGVKGGDGGGKIKIEAKTLNITGTGHITADGSDADHDVINCGGGTTIRLSSGAGAGGTVDISADTIVSASGALGPTALGGVNHYRAANSGSNGSMTVNGSAAQNVYLTNVSANGGEVASGTFLGGGGGGGRVKVNSQTGGNTIFSLSCFIDGQSVDGNGDVDIPAYCENKDVTIDGSGYSLSHSGAVMDVYADSIGFKNGTACYLAGGSTETSGAADSECDTKRNFTSLTIYNARLTHHSVLASDFTGVSGNSLASEITGPGRLRKVDVITTGDIVLGAGGEINADGRGYPGGDSVNHPNGYGPGAGTSNNLITYAGGGGFGGVGGTAEGAGGLTYPVPYQAQSLLENNFDFGSGGGGAKTSAGFKAGGAGGGRIRLRLSGTLQILDKTALVSSNGGDAIFSRVNGWSTAFSGAGSGGMVIIEAADFTFPSDGTIVERNGGNGGTASQNGAIGSYDFVSYNWDSSKITTSFEPLDIFANGGTGTDSVHGAGGGGGGRIVIRELAPVEASIKKSYSAYDRNGSANFNPYTLQVGDVIKVRLDIANLHVGETAKIWDELPNDGGNNFCQYQEGYTGTDGLIYPQCDSDNTLFCNPSISDSASISNVYNPNSNATSEELKYNGSVDLANNLYWQFEPKSPTAWIEYMCKITAK